MKPRVGQLAQSGATTGQVLTWNGTKWAPAAAVAPTPLIVINAQFGNTYTLVAADAFALVQMNNAITNTITLPPTGGVGFAIGTFGQLEQTGTGVTKFTGGVGVTLNVPAAMRSIATQWGKLTWIVTAANTYEIEGRLAP